MRILLIQPPSPKIYQAFLPLGLAYIAGSLMRKGHKVTVWDFNAERPSRRAAQRRIKAEGDTFELAGITGLTGDYPYLEWLSTTFKRFHPGTKIVAGGHLASAVPAVLMESLPIDFAVVGEGEETMVDLTECLSSGSHLLEVRGIYFRDGSGQILSTPPRERLAELDNLPLPPWEAFPMDRYLRDRHGSFSEQVGGDGEGGLMSLMASRGCPFDCVYCDHTIKGYKPRYRPVGHVIDEIKILMDRYGPRIRRFYFWDDILIWDRNWTEDFCRSLLAQELKIKWTCNAHVSRVEPRIMSLMKEAGCENVRFGIESGSQKILDGLNKGVRVEKALDALRVCLDAGLSLTLYILVGMTGESEETIEETVQFFKGLVTPLNVYHFRKIHVFMLTPYPGTRLHDGLLGKGLRSPSRESLRRECDGYDDIPANISGRTDQELRLLKTSLEDRINRILESETNRLHNLLIHIKRGSGRT
jgi:anaerobic magnesium-protoporphyrin IX monomethyl ester cyclase